MQTEPADSPASATRKKTPFKGVVVAGGVWTALRARRLLGRAASILKPGFELKPTVWEFDRLASAHLLDRASRDAIEADMVIVAPETATDFPPAIKAMFERWVREARKRVVFLAGAADWERSSNNGRSGSAPVLDYFRQISRVWDFEFSCDADGLSPDFAQQETSAAPLLPEGNLDRALLVNQLATTPPGLVQQSMWAAG